MAWINDRTSNIYFPADSAKCTPYSGLHSTTWMFLQTQGIVYRYHHFLSSYVCVAYCEVCFQSDLSGSLWGEQHDLLSQHGWWNQVNRRHLNPGQDIFSLNKNKNDWITWYNSQASSYRSSWTFSYYIYSCNITYKSSSSYRSLCTFSWYTES